jgi:hypothetical protein
MTNDDDKDALEAAKKARWEQVNGVGIASSNLRPVGMPTTT